MGKQGGRLDPWVTGVGEAVLQLQQRKDLGAGWGAERAVQLLSDQAVWMEPAWKGRYEIASGGQWWLGWHMMWRADQGEELPVRNEWGGELPEVGKDTSRVRTDFTTAALAPAPTTEGHRGQEMVYTFREEMTLIAAEAISMGLDEGAARLANRTYHVPPHTGDR